MRAVVDEALECKKAGKEKIILTLLSLHGFFDMKAYESYLSGVMEPFALQRDRIDVTLSGVRQLSS